MRRLHNTFAILVLVPLLAAASCGSSDAVGERDVVPEPGLGDSGDDGEGDQDIDPPGSDEDPGADDTPPDLDPVCAPMVARLPAFPFEPNAMAGDGQAYLDQLATDYVCGLGEGEVIDNAYFFYGYAPVTAFNRIIDGDWTELREMRWIFHVSGYFGGLWLHAALNPTQQSGDAPSGWSAINATALATEAMDAVYGTDSQLFEYNASSLRGFIFPKLKIASDFGYNRGYLLEIYERPPPGLSAPPDYIRCDGPLWCEYADQRVPALIGLETVSQSLKNGTGRWEELREGSLLQSGVESSQKTGDTMGRQVWGTIMRKDGLDQSNYAELLDISASFLEVVQAAGLFSAKGYAREDAQAGRTGAIIQSGMAFWLASYMAAFPLGQGAAPDLPRIMPAP